MSLFLGGIYGDFKRLLKTHATVNSKVFLFYRFMFV
jgi:hypothetical protein